MLKAATNKSLTAGHGAAGFVDGAGAHVLVESDRDLVALRLEDAVLLRMRLRNLRVLHRVDHVQLRTQKRDQVTIVH